MARARTLVAVAIFGVALGAPDLGSAAPAAEDVGALLRRQIQELFDAVTAGDSTVWDRYLEPDAVYTDEAGEVTSKRALVASIHPLPKGVWGKLELSSFEVRRHGESAIVTFVVEETEGYFGQVIHARYPSTHTWQHSSRGWRLIGAQTGALRQDPPEIALAADRLDEYAGVYELTPEIRYTIRRSGNALVGQRTGRAEEPIKPELADLFFVPGKPRLRKVFQRGADGRITGFVERRESWDILWKRRAQE